MRSSDVPLLPVKKVVWKVFWRSKLGFVRLAKSQTGSKLGFARLAKSQTGSKLGFACLAKSQTGSKLGFACLAKSQTGSKLGFARLAKSQTGSKLGFARLARSKTGSKLGSAGRLRFLYLQSLMMEGNAGYTQIVQCGDDFRKRSRARETEMDATLQERL